MKPYKRVALTEALNAENGSQVPTQTIVHAMQEGERASMCGALLAADASQVADNRVVSCAACTTALVNMRRNSDHRPAGKPEGRLADIMAARAAVNPEAPDDDVLLSDMLAVRSVRATREGDTNLGRILANISTWLLLGHEPSDAPLPDNTSVPQASEAALTQDTEKCRFCGKQVVSPCETAPADVCEKAIERDEALDLAQPREHTYSVQVVSRDAVVEANRKLLLERSNVGIDKYGVTLEQSGLTQRQFIQHALEETLDLANYLQATLMQHPQ